MPNFSLCQRLLSFLKFKQSENYQESVKIGMEFLFTSTSVNKAGRNER